MHIIHLYVPIHAYNDGLHAVCIIIMRSSTGGKHIKASMPPQMAAIGSHINGCLKGLSQLHPTSAARVCCSAALLCPHWNTRCLLLRQHPPPSPQSVLARWNTKSFRHKELPQSTVRPSVGRGQHLYTTSPLSSPPAQPTINYASQAASSQTACAGMAL